MGPTPFGFLDDLRPDVVIGFTRDKGDVGLRDPRLLARNPLQIRPQVIHVLERDLRDRADQRREHIRGIQPTTQTDLDNGDVHVPGGEVGERDGRSRLEEAGIDPLDVRFELGGPFRECILADRHAVYGDALNRGDEMGRRVQPYAPALRAQLVCDEGARRTLPIRATDVDRREMALGMPQDVE